MWALVLIVTLIGSTFAERCPDAPADAKSKQDQLQQVVNSINKYQPAGKAVVDIDHAKYRALGHLDKREVFALFDERNYPEVLDAIKYMLEPKSYDEFIQAAKVLSHHINDELFLYALSVTLLHRPDTAGVHVPRIHTVFPDKFISNEVLQEIRESILTGENRAEFNYTPVVHNYLNVEDRLTYYTSDLGLNSHHHHFHVVHPPTGLPVHQQFRRHGEFFYWQHHQFVVRYEAERLSNHLPLTKPFENWDDKIETGFAPHLTIYKKGYTYTFRPEGLVLRDLPELTKNQMRMWKARILSGIHRHAFKASNHSLVDLQNNQGIDTVTNAVVATKHSINRVLYGNLHNYAHVIAARIGDADGRYGVPAGAIQDVPTSARDPLFYQWHKFIDEILQEHKNTLHPYTEYQLTWPEVELQEVAVIPTEHPENINQIHTYYTSNKLHLDKGFEFTRDHTATVRVTHLNHEPFKYRLRIRNNAPETRTAAVRIFLAPVYDEQGHVFDINQQRKLMIELDKYVLPLKSGDHVYTRSSAASSVTVPGKYFYEDVQNVPVSQRCACGWPDYLLLPRGSYEGQQYQLFVAITNWNEDKVPGDVQQECHCSEGMSYCGTLSVTYPDGRPLGYPFDRPVLESSWEDYLPANFHHTGVTIRFLADQVSQDGHQ